MDVIKGSINVEGNSLLEEIKNFLRFMSHAADEAKEDREKLLEMVGEITSR